MLPALSRVAILVALAASTASADSKAEVDAAIRATVDGKQSYSDNDKHPPWAAQYVLSPDGLGDTPQEVEWRLLEEIPAIYKKREAWKADISDVDWKLGTLAIGVDDKRGVAWFQGPIALTINTCCGVVKDTMRMSGIVVQDGAGAGKPWKPVALALSRQLPDARLFKGASEQISDAVGADILGKTPIEKQIIAGWFAKGGLAKSKASASTIVASGTAPAEYATNAGAVKLAAAWDTIDLRTRLIRSRTFANDAIVMARISVELPVAAENKASPMDLYAIAIPEAGTWHWVSLQFTTPLAKAPMSPKQPPESVVPPDMGSPPPPQGVRP